MKPNVKLHALLMNSPHDCFKTLSLDCELVDPPLGKAAFT